MSLINFDIVDPEAKIETSFELLAAEYTHFEDKPQTRGRHGSGRQKGVADSSALSICLAAEDSRDEKSLGTLLS